MADPITPDMQAAGVPGLPAPTSQGGLLDALRSRGTLPGTLPPQMLAQSMQQAGPGPSGGLAAGSGMLNALSGGNAAQNPYLQQYQAQQNAQVQQALHYQQLQQAQRAQQMRQDELRWKMTEDMTKSKDERARLQGWRERAKIAGPLGVNIRPDIIEGLGRSELSADQLKRVVAMVDDNPQILPEDIGRVTGLSPDLVTQGIQIAGSDASRRVFGILTRSEAEAGRAKDQSEGLKLIRDQYGFTDPKDPRIPFLFSYTMQTFGKPFNQATPEQRAEARDKAESVAPPGEKHTASARNAMAEFNPNGSINNAADLQTAMTLKRAKEQANRLDQAAVAGQLGNVGRMYAGELTRMNQQLDRVGQLDALVGDMDRLVTEGRALGFTNNASTINLLQQEYARWFARGGTDKLSKGAEWYRSFDTLNARFATVAQAVEQITGNRLAVTQTTRALGFHPRQTDPYSVQLRIVNELREASRRQRELVAQNISRADATYGRAAGTAGVPYILGGGQGTEGWSGEEEK